MIGPDKMGVAGWIWLTGLEVETCSLDGGIFFTDRI